MKLTRQHLIGFASRHTGSPSSRGERTRASPSQDSGRDGLPDAEQYNRLAQAPSSADGPVYVEIGGEALLPVEKAGDDLFELDVGAESGRPRGETCSSAIG